MAIFGLSISVVSRSEGRSVTRTVAYTTGTRIVCERRGRIFDYRRRRDVVATALVAPGGRSLERARLWNAAEAAETRINSREGREFRLALPHELDPDVRFALAVGFAQLLVERYGIVADVAIHAPGQKRQSRDRAPPTDGDEIGRGPDPRNHHAHIVTTTRVATAVDYEFGAKCRQLDGKSSGALETVALRSTWAAMCNAALEAAGRAERVDHRSNLARGIDAVPLGKLGPFATDFERRTGKASARRLELEAKKAKIEARFAELDAEAGSPETEPTAPGLPDGTPVIVPPLPVPPVIAPPVIAPPTIIVPVAPPSVPGPSLVRPAVIVRPIVVLPPTIFAIAPIVVAPEFRPPAIVRPVAPPPAQGLSVSHCPIIVEPVRGAPLTVPLVAPEPVSPAIDPAIGDADRANSVAALGRWGVQPRRASDLTAIDREEGGRSHLHPAQFAFTEPDPVRLAAHRDALSMLRHDAAESNRARLQVLLDSAADTVILDAIGSSLHGVLDGFETVSNHASAASPPTAAPSEPRKVGMIQNPVSSPSNDGWERVHGLATPQRGRETETHNGGRRSTPSPPSPQPQPDANLTLARQDSSWSLVDLNATALAYWSIELDDASNTKHRGRFFRTLRLIAAAIGVGDRVLLAAVTAIRDWIAAGRQPDLVEGARRAGAHAADAMEKAAVAGDGPPDLATTLHTADVDMLRFLGEACRVDTPIAVAARPASPHPTVALSPSGSHSIREEPIRTPGAAESRGDGLAPAEPDGSRSRQRPATPADRGKVAAQRRPAAPASKPPGRRGPGLAD